MDREVLLRKAYKETVVLTLLLTMISYLIQLNSYDFNISAMLSAIDGAFLLANIIFPIFLGGLILVGELISVNGNGDTIVFDMAKLFLNVILCREGNLRVYQSIATNESPLGHRNYQTMIEALRSPAPPSAPIELQEITRSTKRPLTAPEAVRLDQTASNANALQEVIVDTQSWVPKVQELSDDSSTSDEESGNSLGV